MQLQNSYIFLKNPYWKEKQADNTTQSGTTNLSFEKNLYDYIKVSFPGVVWVNGYGNIYKRKYSTDFQLGNTFCKVEFVITEVVDTKYLDIIAIGKTKSQIVKCLENVQNTLLSSGIHERYIDIISYDAISEYYCNKIYPKLNILERNLRKLLFNIYIVNFGSNYYKATINEELQSKIKCLINVDSSKESKDYIKEDYKATTKKETEEIERLQRFFYSLEYNDIQKLLFTPSWTSADEASKTKFLDEHENLSELSNKELRDAFSKFIPKSDWERFFNDKINISNIKDFIEQIRLYRNCVAHFKFFYKAEYDRCNTLANRLNEAIIKAIKITEDKDFAEKNAEYLSETFKEISKDFLLFLKSMVEMAQKAFATVIAPTVLEISKLTKEYPLKKFVEDLNKKTTITPEEQQCLPDSNPCTNFPESVNTINQDKTVDEDIFEIDLAEPCEFDKGEKETNSNRQEKDNLEENSC